MPMLDPVTGQPSNAAYGLDTHEAAAGNQSLFDGIGNFISKGVPLTGMSIINSFANTAIDVANFFDSDNKRSRYGAEDWLDDQEYKDYYKAHTQGIEAAGLLVGSFIPGGAAIKGLKLAQAGKLSLPLQRATSLFSGPRDKIIEGALTEVEAGNAALYGGIKADKYKAIALGFGDQALQALAFETATVATMKASPLLDKDSFKDVVENLAAGMLVGGVIGGTIEGLLTARRFAKAELTADQATKAAELATYKGKGDYIAGDRVALLIDSLDAIPAITADSSSLLRKKASATRDAAILNSKQILGSLITKGDETLTNTTMDALLRMSGKVFDETGQYASASLTKDQLYDYLAGLAKVSRINTEPSIPAESRFYVNRFASNRGQRWEDLVSNTASEEATVALSYRVKDTALAPKIGRAEQQMVIGDTSIPRYLTAKDAFDDGMDIFVDSKLRTYINENAPNIERVPRTGESRILTQAEEKSYRSTGKLPEKSKPLYGAPLTLNVINGAVTERALAVVGDFGTPKVFDRGLSFGDKTSLQTATSVITKDTSSIDANARYVWASEVGISKGQTVLPNDIAMLEQMWREFTDKSQAWEDYLRRLDQRGITIEGQQLPATKDSMLNLIRTAKDNLIHDLIETAPGLSSAEIAQRANVTEKYLGDMMRADTPETYIADVATHKKLNHVQLEYDVSSINTADGQILRGMLDVQYRIQLVEDTLRSAHAEHFGEKAEQFLIDKTSKEADITGAGAKGFAASNSNYNSIGQQTERVGREVTDWHVKKMAAVSQILSPATNAIRADEVAAAELGLFRAVRQRTAEKFVFFPVNLITPELEKLGITADTAVLKNSLAKGKNGEILQWDRDYVPDGFQKGEAVATGAENKVALKTFYPLSPKVAAFERANSQVNDSRVIAINKFYAAQGLNRYTEPGVLYTPAIDTQKYPHFALVKARPGSGLADDSVAIITAENAADLEQKIASLRDEYSIYTKDLLKKHHEVLGDYEYDRNFAQSSVNTALSRRGILNNVFPDTRADTIIKDYVDWHSRQELRLTRDYVELGNGQLFAELKAMGERYTSAETSQTGFVTKLLGRTAQNPYDSYVKTALAVSEKDNYRLWADANEKVEAFFSSAFRTAKSAFVAASRGVIPFEEASAMSEKFGLGNPWKAAGDVLSSQSNAYYNISNKLPPERYLSKFVSTANSILSATAIRLDVFQSVINAVSTPVLLLAEANSARSNVMRELITTELPDGSGRTIPATSKLFYNAVSNWFDRQSRATYMPLYKELLAVRNKSSEYFEMIDQLTLPYGKFTESAALANLKKGVELGGKLTGSELSEEFGRFIAADTARQIFEAAGYSGKQLGDNISTFVNRVHGNYVASQRPVAFQGPIGQAIGLFQTYQFNLMQQVFRYVENGEAKSLAILAGMQTTLFGMQGLPGFQAINNHIVGNAAGNSAHKDFYSTVPQLMDKTLGNYMLYGVMSNWMQTGLYSRGDINPRQITILPVNPLEYPAISGGIRFMGSLLDTAEKIGNGGGVPASLLLGLEHNGLSRPLSGLAQMTQGFTTTSKGSLVSTTRPGFGNNTPGINDFFNVATFSRLAGARPLDEAITMDAMYRKTLYKAKDTTRLNALGEAVKSTMYANAAPSSEQVQDFMQKYAASGGNIQEFNKKLWEWSVDANASVANKVFKNLQNPLNQQLMIQMGGVPLPDYTMHYATKTPGGDTGQQMPSISKPSTAAAPNI